VREAKAQKFMVCERVCALQLYRVLCSCFTESWFYNKNRVCNRRAPDFVWVRSNEGVRVTRSQLHHLASIRYSGKWGWGSKRSSKSAMFKGRGN